MSERRIVVATRSPHKLAELRALLDVRRTVLVDLAELGVREDVEESGSTFEENALIKARFFAGVTRLPTLADDSGLEVDALGGSPGVRTRRYAGENATDDENNRKLLTELRGVPAGRRGARYRCVLAFVLPPSGGPAGPLGLGDLPAQVRHGALEGRIALRARGSGGFGYDPIFEPTSEPIGGRTLAEYSAEEKNAVSHRGEAARALAAWLRFQGY